MLTEMTHANPHVQAYIDALNVPKAQARMYDLEHPFYETEEEYRDIMHLWETFRSKWTGTGKPLCPRPARRPGRPVFKRDAKPAKVELVPLKLKVSPEMIAAIVQIKGELTMEQAIIEILAAQLGPLLNPQKSTTTDGAQS